MEPPPFRDDGLLVDGHTVPESVASGGSEGQGAAEAAIAVVASSVDGPTEGCLIKLLK